MSWYSFVFNIFFINPYVKRLLHNKPYGALKSHALVAVILFSVAVGTVYFQMMNADLEPNYYQILQVPTIASSSQITKAYRTAAKVYHPDRNDAPNAEELFQKVQEAYEILKDPELRRYYDHWSSDISTQANSIASVTNTVYVSMASTYIIMFVVMYILTRGKASVDARTWCLRTLICVLVAEVFAKNTHWDPFLDIDVLGLFALITPREKFDIAMQLFPLLVNSLVLVFNSTFIDYEVEERKLLISVYQSQQQLILAMKTVLIEVDSLKQKMTIMDGKKPTNNSASNNKQNIDGGNTTYETVEKVPNAADVVKHLTEFTAYQSGFLPHNNPAKKMASKSKWGIPSYVLIALLFYGLQAILSGHSNSGKSEL